MKSLASPSNVRLERRTLAVGLQSQDYDGAALRSLVGADSVLESDLADLRQTGQDIAQRIEGIYLLALCSAARAGDHDLVLSVENGRWELYFEFNADGFSGGCSAQFFEEVCDARECGGFNCGACDDETESCSGPDDGQCLPL